MSAHNSNIDKFLNKIKRPDKHIEFLSDEELQALPVGTPFIFDAEIYRNFFFIAFKLRGSNKYVFFEKSEWWNLETDKLSWMLWRFQLIGFNSLNFDLPIVFYALSGASNVEIKNASDDIITNSLYKYAFEKQYKIQVPNLNHIDLMEVAPLSGSLKLYGARLHAPRLQDLPYPPEWIMTPDSAQETRIYCTNDLDLTELLANELKGELELRESMSNQYGIDLRSKSDAQIAEAVICSELKKITGSYPTKPNFEAITHIEYNVPSFIRFESEHLKEVVAKLAQAQFPLNGMGSPMWPEGLGSQDKDSEKWELHVRLGRSEYKMGMGGLHSKEKEVCHVATDDIIIADNDFASFYPRIMLILKLFPKHLGEAFLQVYEAIVNRRLDAKKNKLKTIADSLKICINGTFGKLGERFSRIYSPQLLLQVTITGQLILLMLIERLEMAGIQVISGNTDGVILKYHKRDHEKVRKLIGDFEKETKFQTEETRYKAVYSRDVNNYIAIKDLSGETEEEKVKRSKEKFLDDRLGVKTKGCFAERGSALNSILSKNPENLVVIDSVLEYLVNKVNVSETIKKCKDFKRFLSIRTAKGGACKGNEYLGKIVRWYYGEGEKEAINYIGSGNKVANTDGAIPAMDLPTEFPNDIDYKLYIKEANKILYQLQAKENPRETLLFKV